MVQIQTNEDFGDIHAFGKRSRQSRVYHPQLVAVYHQNESFVYHHCESMFLIHADA